MQDRVTEAWTLFRAGRLAEAQKLCQALISRDARLMGRLPLAEIWSANAFLAARQGQHAHALKMLRLLLGRFPDDRYAQELLLLVEDAIARESGPGQPEVEADGTLVIGIGTGRCGSTSLATLLDSQEGAAVTHEHAPVLAWGRGTGADGFHIRRFRNHAGRHGLFGDVAHWWLPRLPDLIAAFPDIRVIVLRREREATVRSFVKLRAGAGGAGFAWGGNREGIGPHNIWRSTYPPSEPMEFAEAIGRYWDRYYAEAAETLAETDAAHLLVETERLGEPDTQRRILEHLGIARERQVILPDLHQNAGTIADGRGHH